MLEDVNFARQSPQTTFTSEYPTTRIYTSALSAVQEEQVQFHS